MIEILPRNIVPDIPPLPVHWKKEKKPIKEEVNLFTDIFIEKKRNS